MKRIYFDNIGENNYWKFLMFLSLIFILVGVFEPFGLKDVRFYKYISATGFLIQVVFYSKKLWFRNMMQWNKKGAVIKLNTILGETVNFNEIKGIEMSEKTLKITKKDDKVLKFDINGFEETDTQKLNEILIENTISGI